MLTKGLVMLIRLKQNEFAFALAGWFQLIGFLDAITQKEFIHHLRNFSRRPTAGGASLLPSPDFFSV
jgi:hypothetical protein